jgi:hypothetical protein
LILFFDFLAFGPRGPLLDHFRGIAKKNRIRKKTCKSPCSFDPLTNPNT